MRALEKNKIIHAVYYNPFQLLFFLVYSCNVDFMVFTASPILKGLLKYTPSKLHTLSSELSVSQ